MKKWMLLIAFAILLYVGLQNTDLVASVLRYLLGLIAPFLIGACLAFILNVPMRFFEKHLPHSKKAGASKRAASMRRIVSLLLTLVVVMGVIAIVLFMVVPELYQSFAAMGVELASARVRVPEWLDQLSATVPLFAEQFQALKADFLDVDWQGIGNMVMEFLQRNNILSSTLDWASSVVSGVTNTIIGIVFAIYVLLQKETLGRQFRRLLYAVFPEKHVDGFLETCNLTSASFNSFLSGQCLEALILGTLFFIAMSIFRMPYALVISVLIAVTALIPVFGAFIGCVVGAVLILMIDPMKALWFVVLFLVLQQLEGNFIYPRVVGSSVGLPPIWVLSAVTLGASIGGVLGMLFAIPLFSVFYTLLRRMVRARLKTRKLSGDKVS